MELIHLPAVRRRSLETLAHTALGAASPSAGLDAAISFNAGTLRCCRSSSPAASGGHPRRRAGVAADMGRRRSAAYRTAESLAVRWSDALIADSHGIQQYFADEFGAATNLIAYGAPIPSDLGDDRIAEFDLARRRAPGGGPLRAGEPRPGDRPGLRGQPGRAAGRGRSRAVLAGVHRERPARRRRSGQVPRARLRPGPDRPDLRQRATYWHGHSVGGTNPFLLRAAGAAPSPPPWTWRSTVRSSASTASTSPARTRSPSCW